MTAATATATAVASAEELRAERAALVAVYHATGGADWRENANWLSDLPVHTWYGVQAAPGERVTALDLWGNGLTGSLPTELRNLTSLRRIVLGDNSITNISALAGMTSLTTLNLTYNPVEDISPLSSLVNLTRLSLGLASIPDLSVLSDLTHLTYLYISDSTLSDISPLTNLTSLTELNLIAVNIEDISALSTMINLTRLVLSHNRIEDVTPLAGLTNLTYLNLWDNGRQDITDFSALYGLGNLEELQLGSNSITDISSLAGLTSLKKLHLGSNGITDISPLAGLTNLHDLDLRATPYETLPKGDYDIELVFLGDYTESQKRALQFAARRWMAVIVADLPDYEFAEDFSGQCGNQSYTIPAGERIDDLRIYVGGGNTPITVGGTATTHLLREDSHLPVIGCTAFNVSHLGTSILIAFGLHEFGHALGFASEVWEKFDFHQTPGDGEDHFNGPLAVAAFDEAGGRHYDGPKVPLKKGESHWSDVLSGEIMNAYVGVDSKLSAITVQALADLGYGVDVTQADDYALDLL